MADADRCVICGEIVPEGWMVCPECEMREADKLRQAAATADHDQWKSGGDCRICRRAPYCKKRCKASENRITAEFMARFRKTAAGRIYNMICGSDRH